MPALLQPEKWSAVQSHTTTPVVSTNFASRKSADAVLVRIALLLVIFAGAMIVVALPLSLLLVPWKAAVVAVGLVLIYGGASFIFGPQLDSQLRSDAMEGNAGGLQFGVVLYWLSVPGRFAAQTLLDVCQLAGVAERNPAEQDAAAATDQRDPRKEPQGSHEPWRGQ